MLTLLLLALAVYERIAAKCWAPVRVRVRVRRQPEIFCRILTMPMSRSARLLSNGMVGWVVKAR